MYDLIASIKLNFSTCSTEEEANQVEREMGALAEKLPEPVRDTVYGLIGISKYEALAHLNPSRYAYDSIIMTFKLILNSMTSFMDIDDFKMNVIESLKNDEWIVQNIYPQVVSALEEECNRRKRELGGGKDVLENYKEKR